VRNPTVITDPQVGPIDPQIVTVLIRPTDLLRSVFVACRRGPTKVVLCDTTSDNSLAGDFNQLSD